MGSSEPHPRIRIVVGDPGPDGPDGPDGGATTLARALRDAGHEVIYTGSAQTAEQLVGTALQEDADLIGLAVSSGAHPSQDRLVELLAERDAADIEVRAFTPGEATTEIVGWVAEHFT